MEQIRFVETPKINGEVAKIIGMLRDDLISTFHPKSIILSGSLATGEAAVVEEDGCLRFLSDCEVAIIPNRYIFSRDRLEQFSKRFYKKTNLKVEISGVTLSLYLTLPLLSKGIKPTMDNYNIKHGAKVLYGRDYLSRMPNFKPQDIPLWEGVRLIFNRMAEGLAYFTPENPSQEMVFWTDKIVLACQDALLVSFGQYHHTYKERNKMFQNLFSAHCGELQGIPNFIHAAAEATRHRLSGIVNTTNPVEYWFDAMEICDKVFRYVIRKDMGTEFRDYLDFQDKYTKRLRTNLCLQARYAFKKFLTSKQFLSSIAILRMRKPRDHVIYSLIPLLYFGLSRDLKINESYLNKVIEVLPSVKKMDRERDSILDNYEYLKHSIYYELIG